jgi:putative MATE family efflux protein
VQSLLLALAVSVVLGALGAVYAPQLLALMGASAGVIEIGGTFARVMLGGEAAIILLFVVNAIFRGAGDAAIAMRVLWGANALNMALAPCLIFGLGPFPRLGVTGAAIATTFGRSAGAAYAIWRLTRPGGRVPVRRGHLRPEPALMAQIARLSGSAAVQSLVGTASWIGLVRIISSFGSAALAGYTIGIRVVIFALLPSFGMSNAAATMVGQALGAGKPERAEEAVWKAGFYNLCFLGGIGALFVLFAPALVSLFTRDPAVAVHACRACASWRAASSSTPTGWCSRSRSTARATPSPPRSSTWWSSGSGRSRWPTCSRSTLAWARAASSGPSPSPSPPSPSSAPSSSAAAGGRRGSCNRDRGSRRGRGWQTRRSAPTGSVRVAMVEAGRGRAR